MPGTSIITHILCRWFGPIREGGWGWAAAKQLLDLGHVGAGEGAGEAAGGGETWSGEGASAVDGDGATHTAG